MRSVAQAGVSKLEGFGLNMFSDEELYAIHCSTLEVLDQTGLKVQCQEALEIFAKGGARVDFKTGVVKIPQYLVEEATQFSPQYSFTGGEESQK